MKIFSRISLLLLCVLFASPLPLRAQNEKMRIATWVRGAAQLAFPKTKIKEALESCVGGGTVFTSIKVVESSSWWYLVSEGSSGGRPCVFALELEKDGEGLVVSSTSPNIHCISENCPACSFRKKRDGRIVGCSCKDMHGYHACGMEDRDGLSAAIMSGLQGGTK